MLAFCLSENRDIPLHKLEAFALPLLLHQDHPEKLFCLKDLITMTYSLLYASKLLETHRNKVRQYTKVRHVQASKACFSRASPQRKIVVKSGFWSPVGPDEFFTQILPCKEQA